MIRKLLSVYLHKIGRLYEQKIGAQPPENKANQALYNRFRKATDEHFQQLSTEKQTVMPSVSLLVQDLAVSANHLNEVIKSITGQTASAHLQRKMILEIRYIDGTSKIAMRKKWFASMMKIFLIQCPSKM